MFDDDFNPVSWIVAILFIGIVVGVLWSAIEPAIQRIAL